MATLEEIPKLDSMSQVSDPKKSDAVALNPNLFPSGIESINVTTIKSTRIAERHDSELRYPR